MHQQSAKQEREILLWFFCHIGTEARLVQRGKFSEGAEVHALYQTARDILRNRLIRGWTIDQIKGAFEAAQEAKIKTVQLQNILKSDPPGNSMRNLLAQEPAPTHRQFFTFTPTHLKLNTETELMEVVSPGNLVLKESYTLEDLSAYISSKLPGVKITENILNWLLNQGMTADLILHATDLAAVSENSPASLFKLQDYLLEAIREHVWRVNGQKEIVAA